MEIAKGEWFRLLEKWTEELPPIVVDNDSDEQAEVIAEVREDLAGVENDIDPTALNPVDIDSLKAFINEDTGSARMTPRSRSASGRTRGSATRAAMPRSCTSRARPCSRSSACTSSTRSGCGGRWRSSSRHPSSTNLGGVKAKLDKKHAASTVERDRLYKRHKDFFELVISIADHCARQTYSTKVPAYKTLEAFGAWTNARELMLPMTTIAQVLFVCKWKSSATAIVCGAVTTYGVTRGIMTASGIAMTIVGGLEGLVRLSTGATWTNAAFQGASAAAGGVTVLGSVSMGLNLPMNFYNVYRSVDEHTRLSRVMERYAVLEKVQPAVVQLIDSSPFFQHLRIALAGKLGRRQTRAWVTGTAAIAGISSTVIGIYATVAVANAWNPVGWALGGIAGVGSIGLFVYRIHRKSVQHEKLEDLRRKYNIPGFVNTAGEWDRFQMADLMYRASLNDGSIGPELLSIGYALLFIIFGGSMMEARQTALKMGHSGIMAFIK